MYHCFKYVCGCDIFSISMHDRTNQDCIQLQWNIFLVCLWHRAETMHETSFCCVRTVSRNNTPRLSFSHRLVPRNNKTIHEKYRRSSETLFLGNTYFTAIYSEKKERPCAHKSDISGIAMNKRATNNVQSNTAKHKESGIEVGNHAVRSTKEQKSAIFWWSIKESQQGVIIGALQTFDRSQRKKTMSYYTVR